MSGSPVTGGTVRAGIYCRMSLADEGDTTKVDDQERLCRITAERNQWQIAEGCGHPLPNGVYQDNNKSAWKHDRKRPAWNQMIADIEAGKISAIIVYNGDRLVRQPADLEILISMSRTRGIKIASPGGVKDLNNDDDQFVLGIEANVWRKESAATSRRRKQQYERWRLQGRVRTGGGGGRAFGFETNGLTHRQDEADVIRKAAAAVLAGQSLGSVIRELNAAGFTTTAGNTIRQASFRRTLLSPRMAGLMPDGESVAAWQPVLERGEWEAVRSVLTLNKAIPNNTSAALHLLSGIARCGIPGCGRPLWTGHNGGGPAYKCHGCGKVGRSEVLLDAYVSGAVVGRLARKDNPAGHAPAAPDLAREFASLTEAKSEAEAAVADPSNGQRLPLLLARLDSIDGRIGQLRELSGESARHRLLARYAGITDEEFDALPLQVRRSLVAACFEVTVLPASRRGPGFRPEDVQLTPH